MAAGAAVPPLPTTTTVTLTSLSSTAVPPPILAPFPPATTTLPVPVVPSQPSLLSVVTQQHSTSTQFAIVAPARVTQPATAEIVNVRDRAYLGAYGATLLLAWLRPETHTLLADDNRLHDLGVHALIAGLARKRGPMTSNWEDWDGLRRISLGSNDIGDKGTIALLRDASRPGGGLESLMCLELQGNRIKLRERKVDEVVSYLNASRLIELNLASNPLNTRGVAKLFEGLTAPVQHIDLCDCDLTQAVVPALITYLGSTAARSLSHLDLSWNRLGEDGVMAIVNAVERRNFTITTLYLEGNSSVEDMGGEYEYLDLWQDMDPAAASPVPVAATQAPTPAANAGTLSDDEKAFDARVRKHSARWNTVLDRNRRLRRRLETAGRKVLGPARILLLGRPASVAATHAATSNSHRWSVNDTSAVSCLVPTVPVTCSAAASRVSSPRGATATPRQAFPILCLPREVVSMIARHCSGDAYAFSDVQWAKVVRHVEQRDTIARAVERTAKHAGEDGCVDDKGRDDVLADWRAEVGCEYWDQAAAK